MRLNTIFFVLFISISSIAQAGPEAANNPSRGELLYSTHCVACHSTRVHWRDKRLVKDWPGLNAEVRRWQNASKLGWSDSDINEVARYLNASQYHFSKEI